VCECVRVRVGINAYTHIHIHYTYRLLRQLHEQVVAVVLGDGFSIALCNKNEAATGVIAAQEIFVSSSVRHEARVAQRSFEEQKHDRAAAAADILHVIPASASRGEKLSKASKTVKRGKRGVGEKEEKEEGGGMEGHTVTETVTSTSKPDGMQMTADGGSVGAETGHGRQTACAGASSMGSGKSDACGHSKNVAVDVTHICEVAVAVVDTPRDHALKSDSESAGACAARWEGPNEDGGGGESRGPNEKRKKKGGSSSRAKALKLRNGDAQVQEPVRQIQQGWMLVHEIVQQVRLPSYIARHLEEPPMQWQQRWVVLYQNELFIFRSPEEAQPESKVLLDGYFVSDHTAETHWGGHSVFASRKKSPGECRIPTLELKPNILFSSCPNNARHLYCRVKDSAELTIWLEPLCEAAVQRMVRNAFTPLDIRPWDADVDWSVPNATAAWDAWRDVDEKQLRRDAAEAAAVDSGRPAGEGGGVLQEGALDLHQGGVGSGLAGVGKAAEAGGVAPKGSVGESAVGSGEGGLAGMMAGLVAGLTPRLGSVTARSHSSSASGSASTKTVAAAGPAGSVAGSHVLPTGWAALQSGAPGNFLPALVGTHMEEMSRVLDETRKQLASLKEHYRVTLHQHALQAAQWSLEKKQVEDKLDQRTVELAAATTEIATLRFECDDLRLQLKANAAANGTHLPHRRSLASAPTLPFPSAHSDPAEAAKEGAARLKFGANDGAPGADATARGDDGGGVGSTGMVSALLMAEDQDFISSSTADKDQMLLEGKGLAQPQPAARFSVNVSGANASRAPELSRSVWSKTAAAASAAAVSTTLAAGAGDGRMQCVELASSLSSPAASRPALATPMLHPPPPPPPRAGKLDRGGAVGGIDAAASLAVPPCPRGDPGRRARIGGCDSSEEDEASTSEDEALGVLR
jgi:hypothetical protein